MGRFITRHDFADYADGGISVSLAAGKITETLAAKTCPCKSSCRE